MADVYESCPLFENEAFRLRSVTREDCEDLLRVYSDARAVPFFNSDNCHGDDFHYTTVARMMRAIDFWLYSYMQCYFVRWAVVDKASGCAVGTVELFRREADDCFDGCGILRLDLRSDYETVPAIRSILGLIVAPAYELFGCAMIATKAVPQAEKRRAVLAELGFSESCKKLFGQDGRKYGSYFVRIR